MNCLMIVDDALIMRMKIGDVARAAGWNVVAEATNGEEAIELYELHQPDMVTLDMVMPKLDGLAALRQIRKANPNARIVMVSAVDQKEKLRDCITSGAMDFIVKPFDPARLRTFFERYRQGE